MSDIVDLHSLLGSMHSGAVSFNDDGTDLVTGTRWDYYTSIFVAVELVGTIGYSPAAPKTSGGRIFTVFYAFIGIPLFLLSVIGLGQLLNLGVEVILRQFIRCRYGRQEKFGDRTLDIILGRRRHRVYRTALLCVLGVGLFVLIPSAIFHAIEGWTYGEAAYYCFITLTTIGFGDYIPGYAETPNWLGEGWYRLAVACWLLIVVGWYACAMAAVKSLFESMVFKAEDTAEQMVDDVINPPRTNYDVNQVGHTSVVNVTRTKDKWQWFWRRPKGTTDRQSSGDVTSVTVRPRYASSYSGGILHSDAFTHTSVIKVGS